ncbi:MAG: RES family NAD+ phosphorylase [Steroidobacteraceae bacterium]
MKVFRTAAALLTRSRKEAFGDNGGLYASARWHTAGHPVVYTAQSLSLAALEILVHLKQTNDVQPFAAFSAEVPDHLILKPDSFPARWKSRLAVSRAFGDAWLEAKTTPAMLVPTIITPGEWNVLINPLHPQFSLRWIVTGPDANAFDARLVPVKKETRSWRMSRP